jgi:cobalt-zinc-cadmium efflux system protein
MINNNEKQKSHNHEHNNNHHHNDSISNIKLAFVLNLSFAIFEIFGGLYTNSMAILSDAIHDFGDSFSLGLAYFLEKISKKGRDKKYSYGYKRFSLLGAIINALILLGGSIFIMVKSIPRLIRPEQVDSKGMFLFAVIGVAVNLIAVLRLGGGKSLNEKVLSLHLLEDVFGWLAVLIISGVMIFVNLPILDPILSIIIAIFIINNVFKNLKYGMNIILQGIPLNVDIKGIEQEIKKIDNVENVHDLHVWTMDGQYNILTLHVVINKDVSLIFLEKLKNEIRKRIEQFNIQHITVEFEHKDMECEYKDY